MLGMLVSSRCMVPLPPVSVVFSSVFNRFRIPVYPASRPAPGCPAPAPVTGEIIWDGRRLRHFPFVFVRFHRYSH
jgi:hypothetical protein